MMMLETGVGEKRENVKSRRSMGNFGGDKRTKQGDEILMCCAVLPAEQPKGKGTVLQQKGFRRANPKLG
jgi:hypothetical protein